MGIAIHGAELATAQVPTINVNTPVLGGIGAVYEVWRTSHAVESGIQGRIRYARTADMLFGCIAVTESEVGPRTPLYEATERAYREIFSALDALGYPHLARIWNYVSEINRDTHGLERYKQFNSARQAAMLAAHRPVTGNVSAACALGAAPGSPLVVYFLASHTAALSI